MSKSIAVIGEGLTEKYFIESLRGRTHFDLRPRSLKIKASSLVTLEKYIKDAIKEGFDEVYCLIDMDNKQGGAAKTNYLNLKNKYHDKIHSKKKEGIQCKVIFIESERCIELWFLYHYAYTTKKYDSYQALKKDLLQHWKGYDKSDRFFRSLKNGLFSELKE